MSKTYLILDCNYLCYVNFYGKNPSLDDMAIDIPLSFFITVSRLCDEFNTENVLFCFDHGWNKRKELYPNYKYKRHSGEQEDDQKLLLIKELQNQIELLKTTHIKQIGFNNVFLQDGYEADDLIASLCDTIKKNDDGIIITSDEDMLQCIKSNVIFYDYRKRKVINLKSFTEKYGIKPKLWWMVKAIGGCTSDAVKGVKGVAETTALKYLTGQLKSHLNTFKSIESEEGKDIFKRNKQLVKLPLKGTWKFKVKKDKLNSKGWKAMVSSLGVKSAKCPFRLNRRKGLFE